MPKPDLTIVETNPSLLEIGFTKNSKILLEQANQALAKAKAIEANKIKQGAKWVKKDDKTYVLRHETNNRQHRKTSRASNES